VIQIRLVVAIAALIWFVAEPVTAQSPTPDYIGSSACADCHQPATEDWAASYHDLAWTQPEDGLVLGDFNDAVFTHRGVTTRFLRRGEKYLIETQGADGILAEFPVVGIAGIAPLQQYLLETEPGRLQAFDIVWDVEKQRWYHLYPDQDLPPGDGLHWTGPYKNWNARCAECHATGFRKNYDFNTRHYSSTEAEIGVGCEACHGPGEAHAQWARDPDAYDPMRWQGLTKTGFTIAYATDNAETEIQQCAGCHSRREPLLDGNPLPGTPFPDAYRLALLREGLYHADGSIQDEVYVYGSFLQSKMYARGVRCSDCHNPHTTRLKAEGNAVCTQCHSPEGNPRFPTLRKALYDDPAHFFHEPGTSGAECKSCHMIERVYMGIDGRRDHSFRIPRPDLSDQTGAPNACNDCHTDQSARWAAREIETRFPNSKRRVSHFSQAFAAARRDPASQVNVLVEIAMHEGFPGIVRATALDLLRRVPDPVIATRTEKLMQDADPLVREAAVPLQRGASPAERVQRLVPLLSDPYLAVRIAAARAFLGAPVAKMPTKMEAALKAAMDEWRRSLLQKSDFPETQMAMGGMALVLRNPDAASAAFREAVRLDPQRVEAWSMVVRILAATGDPDGARAALGEALAANPEDSVLLGLKTQLSAPGAQ